MAFGLNSASHAFVGSNVLTIGSNTYVGGRYFAFFIATTATGGPTDNPTVSSGSLVLEKVGTITLGDRRIIAYICLPPSTVTTVITFTYAETQNAHSYLIYEETALSISFIRNVVSTASATASADPLINLNSTKTANVVACFMNDHNNTFDGTAESGWTEDVDAGTFPAGVYGIHRNGTTDTTLQVTCTSSTWIGIAIQFVKRKIKIK